MAEIQPKKERRTMPRPKGSRNKAKVVVENVDEKIAAVEAEIAKLTADLKEKKTELKKLEKAKAEAAKVAAQKKAEEEKAEMLAAIEKSGLSFAEVMELLK